MTFQDKMIEITSTINESRQRIAELHEKLVKESKEAFYNNIQLLFEEHPVIERIVWIAYTPSYCDGDPCRYSSEHRSASVNGGDFDGDFKPSNDGPEYEKQLEAARKDVWTFMGIFTSKDMEHMFGDPVKVIVTREGIEINDYDCGY